MIYKHVKSRKAKRSLWRNKINKSSLKILLDKIRIGETSVDDALKQLQTLPFEDLGFAQVDHHRSLRQGFPEVVFGQGKTSEQIAAISKTIAEKSGKFIVTRATMNDYSVVKNLVPSAKYNDLAKVIYLDIDETVQKTSGITVVCAGTSDLPVALEAIITAQVMGCEVSTFFDIGVAGIHRLFDKLEKIRQSKVIVAVAGMEGALPSVIGGLVECPIIAVPTSIGYGASFGGVAALLAMLNSCAPGISVVNIDNGFGAGYFAANVVLNI
jgi:NCAIR mutase (PurE)-related protein